MEDLPWALIGDAVKAGKYNLLLGAGASLDSGSALTGEACPTAGGLRDQLQEAVPNVRPGSSLNRLYKTMTGEQVESQITRRFSPCVPGPTVKTISKFRWRRIFTLNVDDALEQAYEQQGVPTQTVSSLNFNSPYSEIRDLRILPIIHLHGFARDSGSGYVFDIKEYMRTINQNNIWAHVLGSLIRTEPFIVLGSSLEEPDLTYFLADRHDLPKRPDRPPSVLVEPLPDAGTRLDCDEYSMSLFPGSPLGFLEEVNRRFPVRPSVFEAIEDNLGDLSALNLPPTALAEFHADFEKVPSEAIDYGDGGTNFAYGHQATWADIQNGRDVARDETLRLQTKLAESSPSAVLVEGLAGSGKTTFLKRLAWNLAQGGRQCFWVRAIGRLRVESTFEVLSKTQERSFVFVDNLADNVTEISILARRLKSHKVTFVGAERSYRLGHIKRVWGGEPLLHFHLGPTGRAAASQLVRAYKNYGLASDQRSRRDVPPLSAEVIAVACCRILNDFEPLEAIIDKSMRDASAADQECYVFCALAAHCYRLGIEYDLVSARFPGYQVEKQTDDIGPLPLKIEEVSDAEFVLPLNDAVADTALRRFAQRFEAEMVDLFMSVARAIRPRVNVPALAAGEPSARIASRLFDYDEVVKPLLGVIGAERFYDLAREEWSWNSRYWHQIAQFRMDLAARTLNAERRKELAELAVQHVRFSKTIEPNHQFTMTMLGNILFGKMRVLGLVRPADLEESIWALNRAISIERQKGRITVHPFMILFTGLAEAIDMGGVLSHEQKGKVLSAIAKANEEFPRDRDLLEQAQRVRKLL